MTVILVADRDDRSRHRTTVALRLSGCTVHAVPSLIAAESHFRGKHLDAVIVDPMTERVPEIIAELRSRTSVPIIVVSSSSDQWDKVAALDAGADDYLTRPLGYDELLARLRAVLRRAAHEDVGSIVETDDFTIEVHERRATRLDGVEVHLTPTEWRVVELLLLHPGHLVDQREILNRVWGRKAIEKSDYLRVFMVTIRRKLEPDPSHPRYFITIPGLGLRFDPTGGHTTSHGRSTVQSGKA